MIDLFFTTIKYNDFIVIKDFTLMVNPGEIVTIYGPSGCGKSTILKAILGQIPVVSGNPKIDGIWAEHYRAPIAYVPQDNELIPWKTIGENVSFWNKESASKAGDLQAMTTAEALVQVRLDADQDKLPSQLSGGMARRAALARGLATNASLILLDEAFVSVERSLRRKIMVDIRNYIKRTGKTCISISHDLEETVFMSDRVVLLDVNPTTISDITVIDLPAERVEGIFETAEFKTETLKVIR